MKGILWAVPLEPIVIPLRHIHFPFQPHITLAYGVSRAECQHLIGVRFAAILVAEFWTEKVQAIGVKLPEGIECQLRVPHITLSWAEGASPNDSSEMLLGGKFARTLGGATGIEAAFEVQFFEWEETK